MCGIAGYFSYPKTENTSLIRKMLNEILHRGPDDAGFSFCDISEGSLISRNGPGNQATGQQISGTSAEMVPHNVAMGHCRYSVIDLTPNGHQPFTDEGFVLCFNGEIYNYLELRSELEQKNLVFHTRSDTEVVIKAFQYWGTECFHRFNGPFAVAVLDVPSRKLILARDKAGKSPLYFTVQEQGIYWASEINPLLKAFPTINRDINFQSVNNYVLAGVRDHSNATFWNQVRTLDAASFIVLDCTAPVDVVEPISYWRLPEKRWSVKDISMESAKTRLSEELAQAVKIRLRSDLPVGLSLSGGMDSSSLVALYCQHFDAPISTYTIKYDHPDFNEEPYARAVAEMYPGKIQYNVITGGRYDMMDDLDAFIRLQEEPFHSPVLYTDFCLQKELKKQGIGVNINGAAGDEVLAGYSYFLIPFLKYLAKNNPKALIAEMRNMPGSFRKKFYFFRKIFKADEAPNSSGRNKDSAFNHLSAMQADYAPVERNHDFNKMMKEYFSDYQMNYWLRSGNKTMYGVPIEPRNPFLDINVVELGFSLPPEYLIHNGWFKYVLRKAMEGILPESIVWRKQKMGFPFMLKDWLSRHQHTLCQLIESSEIPFVQTGYLVKNYSRLNSEDHLMLWRWVSLVLWYDKIVDDRELIP